MTRLTDYAKGIKLELRKLGTYIRRAICEVNPDTNEDLLFRGMSNFHAVKITALTLSGGNVGHHRPSLESYIKSASSPQEFIEMVSILNVRIPTPDEFYTSWENRNKIWEQNYKDGQPTEHMTEGNDDGC